jgi:DNA polymerase-3 subunit epsilon
VKESIQWVAKSLPTLALIDVGRTHDERSCLLIEEGVFKGMGYFSCHTDILDLQTFRSSIEAMPDNDHIRNLIYREAREFPEKCMRFEDSLLKSANAEEVSASSDAHLY